MRAVLQLFNIRAHMFPDRIEIQGAIPRQVIDMRQDVNNPKAYRLSVRQEDTGGEEEDDEEEE